MRPWVADLLRREARKAQIAAVPRPSPLEGCFDKQQEAASHRGRLLVLFCGRRSGKSDFFARKILDTMEQNPGKDLWIGYVTLTQGTSVRNLQGPLEKYIEEYGVKAHFRTIKNQTVLQHDNGCTLLLGGVDEMRDAQRLRGNKWILFVIDECGTFPESILHYLVVDVLMPALTDTMAPLYLGGTPGPFLRGWWHDITTGKNPAWPVLSWTALDNPHHTVGKDPSLFEPMLAELGLHIDDAIVQREWLCRWVADTLRLIYVYDDDNLFLNLPELEAGERWRKVLSIDVGESHSTTFTVTYSRKGRGEIYALESFGQPNMTTSEICATVQRLITKHETGKRGFDGIVVDPGGGGAKLVTDLGVDYGVVAKAAQKPEKLAGIRTVQDLIKRRMLKVHAFDCAQLLSEWSSLVWDEHHRDHHTNCDDDCSDGLIYGVREHDTREAWVENEPTHASPEWWRKEAQKMRKARQETAAMKRDLRASMRGVRR